jgi:hypothetical protein
MMDVIVRVKELLNIRKIGKMRKLKRRFYKKLM